MDRIDRIDGFPEKKNWTGLDTPGLPTTPSMPFDKPVNPANPVNPVHFFSLQ
ncbi:hypothetical protein [Endothiovibrio diazotrophicus]